jgi:uncharacterized protein (DUF362 family)
VCIRRSDRPDYGDADPNSPPELNGRVLRSNAALALRALLESWKLDQDRIGTSAWNPLGEWIRPGSRVLIKPNWVLHQNQSGRGMDCLVTHTSVLEAILEYVALASPGSVIIGDAPVQGCDFESLRRQCNLDRLVRLGRELGLDVAIRDFRRTVLSGIRHGSDRREDIRPQEHYVLFDLGRRSLLEELARDAARFRVTMYHPDALRRTHRAGVHRYLVAREAIEADTVINVPKLKSHKKSCVTGALKNLVGINGNKEYLPHHRKGGSGSGGDCYPGSSAFKAIAESLLDMANRRQSSPAKRLYFSLAFALNRVDVALGGDRDLEGSWYGNDTIWRTCLDLQRILHYGNLDGSMARERQRNVIHITDAIIGGEGAGPLAPLPVESGFLTGSANPAAAEWVHCRLMGFDPARVPLVREAFAAFAFPLVDFPPGQIEVRLDGVSVPALDLTPLNGRSFLPPPGWVGHCELEAAHARVGEPAAVA